MGKETKGRTMSLSAQDPRSFPLYARVRHTEANKGERVPRGIAHAEVHNRKYRMDARSPLRTWK